jgi:hypothetical protein
MDDGKHHSSQKDTSMTSILGKLRLSLILILLLFPLQVGADMTEDITFLYGAGNKVHEQSAGLIDLTTQAVYFASQWQGVLTTAGSIIEVQPGGNFTYVPSPADLMRVEFLNGQVIECTITDLNGQDFSDPIAFLRGDHVLRFELQWTGGPGPLSVSIFSTQNAGQRQGYVQGLMPLDNQAAEVNLNLAGSSSYVSDLSGSEYRTQYTWQGTVATPAMTVNVDESRDFEVIVVSASNEPTQSVSRSRIQLNSHVMIGPDRLAFNQARIQTVFRDGQPSDEDYWAGSGGQLLHNQTVIGEIKVLYEYPYVKIQLLLANGEAIDLQQWLVDSDSGGG